MTNTDPRRHNPSQRAPGVDDIVNRYAGPNVVFEKAIAHPARNRSGQRAGQRQAEEGLWPMAVGPFYGSVYDADHADHQTYDVVKAPDGRVEPGRTNPAPAVWGHVPDAALDSFAQAADFGDPGRSRPFDMRTREGARANVAPRTGLARGERVNPAVVVHTVEESAPWRYSRPNAATVKD